MATTLKEVCPNHLDGTARVITGIAGDKWCWECGVPEHEFIPLPR
jgi:hypothetical protein